MKSRLPALLMCTTLVLSACSGGDKESSVKSTVDKGRETTETEKETNETSTETATVETTDQTDTTIETNETSEQKDTTEINNETNETRTTKTTKTTNTSSISDVTSIKSGWNKVNNNWYYYSSSNTLFKGWLFDQGNWYYLDSSGKMQTGWLDLDNHHYICFFNTDGVMQTGWTKINGGWYFFEPNGLIYIGWLYEEGKWYNLSGRWANLRGDDRVGKMQTGWFKADSRDGVPGPSTDYYYAYPNGQTAIDTIVDKYYVDSYGQWISLPALEEAVQILNPLAKAIGAQIDGQRYVSPTVDGEGKNFVISIILNKKEIIRILTERNTEEVTNAEGDKSYVDLIIDASILLGCPMDKAKLTNLVYKAIDLNHVVIEDDVSVNISYDGKIHIDW